MFHKWFNALRNREEGMTLIELIVVVAIIGVLAWLVTPRIIGQIQKSKRASLDNFANELMAAFERYAADGGQGDGEYPDPTTPITTLAGVRSAIDMNIGGTAGFLADENVTYDVVNTAPATFFYCMQLHPITSLGTMWVTNKGVFTDATQFAAFETANGVDCTP